MNEDVNILKCVKFKVQSQNNITRKQPKIVNGSIFRVLFARV